MTTTRLSTEVARFVDTAPASREWRLLHRVADRHLADFLDPFARSVEQLRARVTDEMVAEDMAGGLIEPPRRLLDVLADVVIAKAADPAELATHVYADILVATVLDMAEFVERRFGELAGRLALSFRVTSPFVLRAAETLTATMIRGVSDQTRRAVRRIVFNAIRDGMPPREAARLIRNVVGLTERQALAVERFRALQGATGVSPARLDDMTERFARRKLRDRAMNIARTETMRAGNRGQQLLWEQMTADRLIDTRSFRQRWLTTPDDRLCPRCAPMNGKVVHIGGRFTETERGVLPSEREPVAGETVQSPPLHSRCRCVVVADVDD